jgi:prevent-host-death family protein
MPKMVNVHEAKTHLSRLLEEVHAGREIILAKGGKPYAKLVPLQKPKRVPLGFLAKYGSVPDSFFDPLPEDELAAWEGAYSTPIEELEQKERKRRREK